MKIIVTDKMAEDGIEYLKEAGFTVDTPFGISEGELLSVIADYDGIIVRSATKVNSKVIEAGVNLKVVGRAGNGVDNIDVNECTRRGIVVVNTPEGNTLAAAELTVGLIFALFRNIPQAYMAAKNRDFSRGRFVGNELESKVAGVIGMGRIGSIVASKLKALNMKVIAYDPFVTDERYVKMGIRKCETINDLLKEADLVTVHIPKTDKSQGLISKEELALCKKGVRIINVARGGIVNEEALYEAIKSGHVAGAAIDVFEREPDFNKKPEEQDYINNLLTLDNVIYTPHLGASSEEAGHNVSRQVALLVAGALKGEMVAAVNMPPIKIEDIDSIKPFSEIAEILGKIYYQAEQPTVCKLEVIVSGDLVTKDTKLITLSALKGLLHNVANENINYVNAGYIAKSMGIEVVESKSSYLDKYTNLITLKFTTKEREQSVSGTVFTKDEIRIVDFFGYKLDFEPTPYVIAIQNIDKPGIIGRIGTILGSKDINIAAMQWSRNRKGEKAVAFVSVDCEVCDETLNKLREIDGVLKATMLKF